MLLYLCEIVVRVVEIWGTYSGAGQLNRMYLGIEVSAPDGEVTRGELEAYFNSVN